MSLSLLWIFLGATLLFALSPGPNVLFIIAQGMRHGYAAVGRGIAGVVIGSCTYMAIAVTSLGALLAAFPGLITVLRLAGAVYLVQAGVRALWSLHGPRGAEAAPAREDSRSQLQLGFWTTFSNPKALIYWSAFLPQFVAVGWPVPLQLGLLGLIGILVEALVLAGYGSAAALTHRSGAGERYRHAMDVVAGISLTAIGCYLGWLHFAQPAGS